MNKRDFPERASVLIVDDEPTYIQSLAKLLQGDYFIQVANSGPKALEIAAGKDPPHLILLDIDMPGMNGYEVCRRLQASPQAGTIPVIFVTARDSAKDEEKGLGLGAVDYISKPFFPAIVRARVKTQVLQRQAEEKIKEYTRELEFKGIELESLYSQLDREIDKARHLHQQTLPKNLPSSQDLSVAAYYQPAQKLGGDYYNVIKKGDRLILYLSDVSGHGLDGAMLSIFAKEAINSYISLRPGELNPQDILKYLNTRYQEEEYPGDYFICIFLAILEVQALDFTYASAGFHTMPLIYQGDRGGRLYSEGPPISTAFPPGAMIFPENTRRLTPGTTILISTDGLYEQVGNHNQEYGQTERLERVFYQNSHLPPPSIVNKIIHDFRDFNPNPGQADDDITFLVLQVNQDKKG